MSSALFSLGHGANDAQKTMGIIMAMLIAKGHLGKDAASAAVGDPVVPAAMGLGTLSGGWRIVKTMGMRLTKLKPVGGFCAETGGGGDAVPGERARRPGVDHAHHHRRHRRRRLGQPPSGVRWRVACRIVWAWLFTIQAAALIAAGIYTGLRALGMK